MDNLEIAKSLIDKAIKEKKRLDEMESKLARLDRSAVDYWHKYDSIKYSYKPLPRAVAINDYIKLSRKLLLESYM